MNTAIQPANSSPDAEAAGLQAVAEALQAGTALPVRLLVGDSTSVLLPAVVVRALGQLVAALVQGEPAEPATDEQSYTIAEAADLLGIWAPYLLERLERGEIPHRVVGGQLRIADHDLIAYRAELRERRAAGVRAIQQLSEELGAYDR